MGRERTDFDLFTEALGGKKLIEASAGTGKTYTISALYLRFIIEKDLMPENILVVTFTIAATEELNDRIRKRLYEALQFCKGKMTEDDEFYIKLFASKSKQSLVEKLQTALSNFDRAAIYTIHIFCRNLLTSYIFEAGTQFNLNAETNTDKLLKETVCDFWRQHMEKEKDNPEWIQWLVENKQTPDVWLDSVKKYLGKPKEVQKIVTLPDYSEVMKAQKDALSKWEKHHDEVFEIIVEHVKAGNLFSRETNLNKLLKENPEQYKDVIDTVLRMDLKKVALNTNTQQVNKQDYHYIDNIKGFCQEFIDNKKYSEAKNVKIEHEFFTLMDIFNKKYIQLGSYFELKLKKIYINLIEYLNKTFPEEKSNQSIMDFSDMLLKVYDALNPGNPPFSDAVQQQYKLALIDEFQDTDPIQIKIFEQLFTDSDVYYVGDPKQSIYKFRGADIYAYYQATSKEKNIIKSTLKKNFRSTRPMIDSINALFHPQDINPFLSDEIKMDWVSGTDKTIPYNLEHVSGEEAGFTGGDKNAALQFYLAASDSDKGDSKFTKKPVAEELAAKQTAIKISELLSQSNSDKESVKPGDIAVLVPSHRNGDQVIRHLSELGISCVKSGTDKVLQGRAALTMLRLLQVLDKPNNDATLLELMADPLLNKPINELYHYKNDDKEQHSWEELIDKTSSLKQEWQDNGFSAMFRKWLKKFDVPENLLQYREGERLLTDLMHISELLQEQSQHKKSLTRLIHWLQYAINEKDEADEQVLRLESDDKRVNIVTIHSAKGLQYNFVFCPFLWAGRDYSLPSKPKAKILSFHKDYTNHVDLGSLDFVANTRFWKSEEFTEQLRLLYVALTRSVYRCYIFWAFHDNVTSSSLSWLLYGSKLGLAKKVSFDELKQQLKKSVDFECFKQGVIDLCHDSEQRHPDSESVHSTINYTLLEESEINNTFKLRKDKTRLQKEDNEKKLFSIAPLPNKPFIPAWWQSSFSKLVDHHTASDLGEKDDDSDKMDDANLTASNREEDSIFTFPSGSQAGLCIHKIFELWDYSNPNRVALNELIEDQLERYNIDNKENRKKWSPILVESVLQTLNTPLPSLNGLKLNQLSQDDYISEMSFTLNTKFKIEKIEKLISASTLPETFKKAIKQIDEHWSEQQRKTLNGFLVGEIDLVFKDSTGKYHILDWKSNFLGNLADDYTVKAIENKMAESHYYLQALIYMVALHRFLTKNLNNYSPERHLGLPWYVFVRGIDSTGLNGIYHFSALQSLIESLDSVFQGEGL